VRVDVLHLLSIHLPTSRPQRALHSRCFPYSPRARPRWPAQRTTCVHVISVVADCSHVMIRLGGSTWKPTTNWSARSRETHASTQAMESSVLVDSYEGVRSYCGKSFQTINRLSGEFGPRIGSQGGCSGRHRGMVKLFYVSVHYYPYQKFRSDILFQYRFHGRYGVNISHIF
jgi:hypothetical protein